MLRVSYVIDEDFTIRDFACSLLPSEDVMAAMAERDLRERIVGSYWDFFGCLN